MQLDSDLAAPQFAAWVAEGDKMRPSPVEFCTYKGSLEGDASSIAVLSTCNGQLVRVLWARFFCAHALRQMGSVITGDEMYFIEPGMRFFDEESHEDVLAGEHVVYRRSDVPENASKGKCGVDHSHLVDDLARTYEAASSGNSARATGDVYSETLVVNDRAMCTYHGSVRSRASFRCALY